MDKRAHSDTYRLLDAGAEARLEEVGGLRLFRPCPQAVWPRTLPAAEWAAADAVYHRSEAGGGQWEYRRQPTADWTARLGGQPWQLKATGFGHLGLFPEQLAQWRWLEAVCRALPAGSRTLNLFAYTGGSTLAMARGGVEVSHVDAARGVVAWARDNARLQGLEGAPVHWVIEDVMKFCHREARRGRRYRGIVLDPPSFGRGPTGELWKLESDLTDLLELCRGLLEPAGPAFVLLSAHSPGFSPLVLENALAAVPGAAGATLVSGEMTVPLGASGRLLPAGCFARWGRGVNVNLTGGG